MNSEGKEVIELIGFELCPFTQRASIILNEKNIKHQVIYIDLLNKPDWFLALSPLGEIPLLKIGDDVIFKANIICEFLNDEFLPDLHPENNLQKAYHRSWIEFTHTLVMSVFFMSIVTDETTFVANQKEVFEKLQTLENEIKSSPFFSGEYFSLIDTAYAPVFMRLAKLNELYTLDLLENFPKVQVWSNALLEYPSVIASKIKDYNDTLHRFLKKKNSYLVHKY